MKCYDSLAIVLVSSTISISFTLLAPVIPLELLRRKIDPSLSGIILSCFSIPWVVIPLFLSNKCTQKCGRRNTLQIGILVLSVAMIIYGSLRYIPDDLILAFVSSSIIARTIEGSGSAISYTALIPLLSLSYAQNRHKAFSSRSCGSQLGKSIGYALGGVAFTLLGYFGQFLLMGALTLGAGVIAYRFSENRSYQSQMVPQHPSKIGLMQVFTVKRTFLAWMNIGIMEIAFVSFEPILALKLHLDYHYSPIQISEMFSLLLVTNFIGASICLIFPSTMNKRKMTLITNAVLIPGLLLTGPSSILSLPDSQWILLSGLAITGLSVGISKTLSFVEAVEGGLAKFPEQHSQVSNSFSRLNIIQFGVINLVVPPFSSILNKWIGFAGVLDGLAIMSSIFYILLLIFTLSDLKDENFVHLSANEQLIEAEQGI